jgi:hypothetical protein
MSLIVKDAPVSIACICIYSEREITFIKYLIYAQIKMIIPFEIINDGMVSPSNFGESTETFPKISMF